MKAPWFVWHFDPTKPRIKLAPYAWQGWFATLLFLSVAFAGSYWIEVVFGDRLDGVSRVAVFGGGNLSLLIVYLIVAALNSKNTDSIDDR